MEMEGMYYMVKAVSRDGDLRYICKTANRDAAQDDALLAAKFSWVDYVLIYKATNSYSNGVLCAMLRGVTCPAVGTSIPKEADPDEREKG
jgi:hypothetical protein